MDITVKIAAHAALQIAIGLSCTEDGTGGPLRRNQWLRPLRVGFDVAGRFQAGNHAKTGLHRGHF